MQQSIERFTLDLSKSASDIMIDVKKGDTYKRLLITLRKGSGQFSLSEGDTATLNARLPGGSVASVSCDLSDNVIGVDITSDFTLVAGVAECEIELSCQDHDSQTQILRTPSFYLRINESIQVPDTE